MRARGNVIGLILALAVTAGCRGHTPSADRATSPHTAVLVTIDTWRRDATGFLGDRQPSPTPFIDRLASGGVVFFDAVTPVPLTAPSHLSMLTCRWPWRSGARNNGDVPVLEETPTLASLLKENGWRTAAFVSASVLDHRFGLDLGFEHYDDTVGGARGVGVHAIAERTGDATVTAALEWIRANVEPDERLFVWLHLFDPHFPYRAHGAAAPNARAAYEAEVRFSDEQVRRFHDGLARIGRRPATGLWVILADHGEALGEHGEQTHGFLLHGATTRIPMLIAGAGRHGRSNALASTVDLMPTILGMLGIASPDCDGRDLLAPQIENRAIPMETVYGARSFGLSEGIGLRTREWLWESSPNDHLWNLTSDPSEARDIAPAHPDVVARMRKRRSGYAAPRSTGPVSLDPGLRERLRSLGYVGTAGSDTAAGSGDVREFVREDEERFARIMEAEGSGDLEAAERDIRVFLDRHPRAAEVWLEAGFIAVQRGDLDAAATRFSQASKLTPADPRPWLNLGNVHFQAGRFQEAEADYHKALAKDPREPFALFNLALVLERQGKDAEAVATWRRFLELHPSRPEAAQARRRLAELVAPSGRARATTERSPSKAR